jgi:hypothetical protein
MTQRSWGGELELPIPAGFCVTLNGDYIVKIADISDACITRRLWNSHQHVVIVTNAKRHLDISLEEYKEYVVPFFIQDNEKKRKRAKKE